MLGIEEIASYIPEKRISNYEKKEEFGIDDNFIQNKIGVIRVSIKEEHEEASDLCVKAYEKLKHTINVDENEIQALVLITQNPDTNIPHTSAVVHGKLGITNSCACFDVSLGCSGYVYGLSIIQSFMKENNLKKGLLFTADPYSKIIDPNDKNTALLFGDAATVTFISDTPRYTSEIFSFGTVGNEYRELICSEGKLKMNGRSIFNFTAKYVPDEIKRLLLSNHMEMKNIDRFIFHQGSRFILDTIKKRLNIDDNKVPFDIADYGNTVSSSIPIILEKEIANTENKVIVICGFGVGLSWASGILSKQ